MERFSNRKIDEIGTLTLPKELTKKAKWERDTMLTFTKLGNIAILQSEHKVEAENQVRLTLEVMNRVIIPIRILDELGWDVRCEVRVYYLDSGVVVLQKEKD